ncbi:MAG TPA: endonuclease domain-containing protein [Asticcacaulis sp.]|nr:endonuclease domain-containing protein [Asticcacaulis sp.]
MRQRETVELARKQRREMSLPEMLIWSRIKGREPGKAAWRRQYPIGPYVLDFYCAKAKLAVEIDGVSPDHGDRPEKDDRRMKWLEAQGLEIMRIPAADVLQDPRDIVEVLRSLARDRVAGR